MCWMLLIQGLKRACFLKSPFNQLLFNTSSEDHNAVTVSCKLGRLGFDWYSCTCRKGTIPFRVINMWESCREKTLLLDVMKEDICTTTIHAEPEHNTVGCKIYWSSAQQPIELRMYQWEYSLVSTSGRYGSMWFAKFHMISQVFDLRGHIQVLCLD